MTIKPNLLIADTNPHDLQLLEISLRNVGFSVTTATSGLDALKKVEIFPPDMIISETDLGDVDGFEFCQKVKANKDLKEIPFLFLSSAKDLQSKVRGLELGVEDYLTKPIFLVELVARVRLLLQRKEREELETRESKTRFTGPLNEIGLMDILQTIELSKKTGVIHLAHEGESGALFFKDGEVIDAELQGLTGEEAVYRAMRWTEGFFDIDFRPIRREKCIMLGPQELLLEGIRRLDEWSRILEQLPPMTTVFDVDIRELVERLDELPDEVNQLLALTDGMMCLEEVVDKADFSDIDTLRIISKLIFFGILVETDKKSTSIPPPPPPTERGVVIGKEEESELEKKEEPEP
ncbi:MAG: DUF4388 domain-containing protein, partial [Deltaproteobacteria bacterium]|nr:DUF4388 domain-containing protein [Deltaproteobacteria bacterium]